MTLFLSEKSVTTHLWIEVSYRQNTREVLGI